MSTERSGNASAFVKLTGLADQPVYVAAAHVTSVASDLDSVCTVVTVTDFTHLVAESPAQVVALVDAALARQRVDAIEIVQEEPGDA